MIHKKHIAILHVKSTKKIYTLLITITLGSGMKLKVSGWRARDARCAQQTRAAHRTHVMRAQWHGAPRTVHVVYTLSRRRRSARAHQV